MARSGLTAGTIRVTLLAFAALAAAASGARAQGLTVIPVTINMAPGQQAAVLTVENHEQSDASFQVRAFAWSERDGHQQLDPTTDVLASPPLGSIAASGVQVVRIVLRRAPKDREATYRILLDQIPPPAKAGSVNIVLRQSLPVFAQPQARVAAHLAWRVERDAGHTYLVATNDGTKHESVRDIVLTTAAGAPVKVEGRTLPYVLAGSFKRWQIDFAPGAPAGAGLRLAARSDGGPIETNVPIPASP